MFRKRENFQYKKKNFFDIRRVFVGSLIVVRREREKEKF
jgi:hypothetical protein